MAAEKPKPSSLFDSEALIEAQRRNFQALANAGTIVADGMRSFAERQGAIVRESMTHLWSELQSAGKRAPTTPTDQLERMRSAFERVVNQVQELGQHMIDVQSQAMAVLNECATRNLEVLGKAAPDLVELQQKAKDAFEKANVQTSAVIDEMKQRMASLERETRSTATTVVAKPPPPASEPASAAAPAPADPPSAPKAAPPVPAKSTRPRRTTKTAAAKTKPN